MLLPLFPILLLGGSVCAELQVSTDPSSRALLGSAALLRCLFKVQEPISPDTLRVQWFQGDVRILDYNWGSKDSQPRASILEEELRNGNASLTLTNLTLSDARTYRCAVRYKTEEQEGETFLDVFATPRISIPVRSAVTDTETTFLCDVGGFYPPDINIIWLRDGTIRTDSRYAVHQENPDGTFNLTLTYTFTPQLNDRSSTLTCQVHHQTLEQPLEESFSLEVTCAGVNLVPPRVEGDPHGENGAVINVQVWLEVSEIQVLPQWDPLDMVPLAIQIQNFSPRTLYWIEWRWDPGDRWRDESPETHRNPDGTFSATSICRIPIQRFSSPELRVKVLVQQTPQGHPIWRELQVKETDKEPNYHVSEVQGPGDCELGQEVTLSCSMEGAFPEDTVVMWKQIGAENGAVTSNQGDSEGSELQPLLHALPSDWTVTRLQTATSLVSFLTFTPTVQDNGARVRCSFHHDGKGIRETRRSDPIRVQKETI
uniref:Ig-like domain-containing protein n=1 Tax=Sphenodon punctatus TaxID=8508 RepID=A0A8D0HJ75_SPHPU